MRRINPSNALIVALLVLVSPSVAAKQAKFVASGWTHASSEIDTDASMSGGSVGQSFGRSNLGPFTAGSAGELADWDGSSFCDVDPDTGVPRGVLLSYIGFSQVVRFTGGDLMNLQLDSSPQSTLCFSIVDNASFTFEVHLTVAGGTGRFDGATGTLTSIGSGTSLSATLSNFEAATEGQIWFERPGRGDGTKPDHE